MYLGWLNIKWGPGGMGESLPELGFKIWFLPDWWPKWLGGGWHYWKDRALWGEGSKVPWYTDMNPDGRLMREELLFKLLPRQVKQGILG